MLHLYDPAGAETARDQGKLAPEQANPHTAGSFYAYCWQAGQTQDDRSIEDLHRDWTKLCSMDD
jgi:hypothetical protein